jgi:hypothetical protein
LDPLAGAANTINQSDTLAQFSAPSSEALDRLYRPQALDVPVLVARDGPISTLNPGLFGALAAGPEVTTLADVDDAVRRVIQVNESPVPEVQLVAARPAWIRVRAADGSVIFEGILDAGDKFALPSTEKPATLRVGESGAIYFAVNGAHFGPAGLDGAVTSKLDLSAENLTTTYAAADLTADQGLAAAVSLVAEITIE